MAGLDLGMRFLSYAALWKCQCKLGVTFATVTADCFYFNGLPQDIQQERMRASTVATRGSAGWTRHDYLIIQKSNAFRSEGGKARMFPTMCRSPSSLNVYWCDSRFAETRLCALCRGAFGRRRHARLAGQTDLRRSRRAFYRLNWEWLKA